MKIAAIAAIDRNYAIGRRGELLCHLPADMKHFKATTMGHPIIMGRKTYESFPRRPLPGRLNIVLTRQPGYDVPPQVAVCSTCAQAVEIAKGEGKDRCFVIGGGQIYADFAPMLDELFLTLIDAQHDDADAFFPRINLDQWTVVSHESHAPDERNALPYTFIHLVRRAPAE